MSGTYPDNATAYREREEANGAHERWAARVGWPAATNGSDTRKDDLIRDLYLSLHLAMMRFGADATERHERARRNPKHDPDWCWRCQAIGVMREVEKQSPTKLRGLAELGIR